VAANNNKKPESKPDQPANPANPANPAELKAKMYYESCMDADGAIEALAGKPLLQMIANNFGSWPMLEQGKAAPRVEQVQKKRALWNRGCQIFLAKTYQNEKNIPTNQKIYQMDLKYTRVFHCKTLKNFPKVGFLVLEIYHLANLFGIASNVMIFKTISPKTF
jgi:hypothetical protein